MCTNRIISYSYKKNCWIPTLNVMSGKNYSNKVLFILQEQCIFPASRLTGGSQ